MQDFELVDGGTVVLIIPVTRDARRWTEERIPDDAPRLGLGFAVERRYVQDILDGIAHAGLGVQHD